MNAADPEHYRGYLLYLARQHAAAELCRELDPSGIVQQTLLEAHAAADQLARLDSQQRLAWLAPGAGRNLADEAKRLRAGNATPAASGPSTWTLPPHDSKRGWPPSSRPRASRLDRAELLLRLADALTALPAGQREAVERHYLLGEPVSVVAEVMGKTPAALAGLLKRGLRQLRETLREPESRHDDQRRP